jgi:hypothetical protein
MYNIHEYTCYNLRGSPFLHPIISISLQLSKFIRFHSIILQTITFQKILLKFNISRYCIKKSVNDLLPLQLDCVCSKYSIHTLQYAVNFNDSTHQVQSNLFCSTPFSVTSFLSQNSEIHVVFIIEHYLYLRHSEQI